MEPGLSRYWFCDPCLIRQLLDNLVGNAIKFTHAGEVVIEVVSAPVAGVAGDMLEFRISDTGPGLGAVAEKQIFGAYQPSLSARGESTGDRGLGLFICSKIVLALNGRIANCSPKGGGACFEITLPEALIFQQGDSTNLHSSLLSGIQYQLKLGHPLRRSVENFLIRLGVTWSNNEPGAPPVSDHGLTLVISDADRAVDNDLPGLCLTALAHPDQDLGSRFLDIPVLESNLGALLFEIVLQWRNLEVRNGIRGSSPKLP